MSQESLSEDPATNLAENVKIVIEAHNTSRATDAARATAARFAHFDLQDKATIGRALGAADNAGDGEAKIAAVQNVLQSAADAAAGAPVDNTAGGTPSPSEVGLDASAPNVLGTQNRSRLALFTEVIAVLAVVAAVGVLFSTKDTERVSLLLIGLAGLCVVVAYLTTMGFGQVRFHYGPPNGSAGNTGTSAK